MTDALLRADLPASLSYYWEQTPDALTTKIVARVWGENEVVRRNLGGPRGDLALVHRRLISLASVANNTFHLLLTTTINGGVITPLDTLQHLRLGVCDIFHIISLNNAAIYVREPLHSRQDRIHILQNNPNQNPHTPVSSNFEDIIIELGGPGDPLSPVFFFF